MRGWVERSKLTYRAAAKLIGFHYTFLSQLLNSDRSPSLKTALRIEKVTGIPVEAWVPTDVAVEAWTGSERRRKPRNGKA